MATAAPDSARASAIARPMPREPPVTTATRPERLRSSRSTEEGSGHRRQSTLSSQGAGAEAPAHKSGGGSSFHDNAEEGAAAGKAVDQGNRRGHIHRLTRQAKT